MSFQTYPEIEADILKTYPKLDRVVLTPLDTAKGLYFNVGIASCGMSLAGSIPAGKDFIDNLQPLYSDLMSMVRSVKTNEAKNG